MQKIEKSQEKTQKILNNIKKELNELIDLNNSNDIEFDKIKKIINEMSNELKEVENNLKINDKSQIISYDDDNDMKVKKKVTVQNKKKSRSFARWLFNNKEL